MLAEGEVSEIEDEPGCTVHGLQTRCLADLGWVSGWGGGVMSSVLVVCVFLCVGGVVAWCGSRVVGRSAGGGVDRVSIDVGETVGRLVASGGGVAGSGVGLAALSCSPLPAPSTLGLSACFPLSFWVFSVFCSSVMLCGWLTVGEASVCRCGCWLVAVGPLRLLADQGW